MQIKSLKNRLKTVVYVLFLASAGFSCQDKAGADFIHEASRNGVAVGAYGGFVAAFPDAENVTWTNVQQRIWEARFSQDAVEKAALFRTTGTMLDHGLLATTAVLPETAQNYLKTTYPDARIQTVLTGPNGADSSAFRAILVNSASTKVWQVQFDTRGQVVATTEL